MRSGLHAGGQLSEGFSESSQRTLQLLPHIQNLIDVGQREAGQHLEEPGGGSRLARVNASPPW